MSETIAEKVEKSKKVEKKKEDSEFHGGLPELSVSSSPAHEDFKEQDWKKSA